MKAVLRVVLLLPFSVLFALISELRRPLYKWFGCKVKLDSVVVSVGNLTSGGTGKTPFVMSLIDSLINRGISVAVVSRSYKAGAKKPIRVDPNHSKPEECGDEPFLIAQNYPTASVFVGASKFEVSQYAVEQVRPQVILVDDGFQHLRLERDLDIVLIDVTEPRWHYLPLPSGYGRDALWQLDRADYIVLTKENLAAESQRNFARSMVTSHEHVLAMDYQPDDEEAFKQKINGRKLLLVSGVGRPETFEILISNLNGNAVGHMAFADHHSYNQFDVDRIFEEKKKMQADIVVTTEKDAVKLRVFKSLQFEVVRLRPKVRGLDSLINEIISRAKRVSA